MIDYRQLKEKVTLLQLLKRYKIRTTKKGSQLVAICPLCKRETFKVSVEKNAFKCFSKECQQKKFHGNILDFVKFLEKTDTIKEAAHLIHSWFCEPAACLLPAQAGRRQAPSSETQKKSLLQRFRSLWA
jgi:DNA primase